MREPPAFNYPPSISQGANGANHNRARRMFLDTKESFNFAEEATAIDLDYMVVEAVQGYTFSMAEI